MRLAEALILRADRQKRIQQLRERILTNLKVQEGEQPAMDPKKLLYELEDTQQQLGQLIRAINRTNAATMFDDTRTIADALADRDILFSKRQLLGEVLSLSMNQMERYSRSELRFVTTVDVEPLQKQVDQLAKQFRELDTRIQEMNWRTDLIEA